MACSTNGVPSVTENNSVEEVSPLEDKPATSLRTVALEDIASLRLNPTAVLFTAQGQEETLKVEAFDSSGQPVSLEGVGLEWLNSDPSVLQVTFDANNPQMATIRSLTDLGSAVLSVRSTANNDLITTPLVVTIAKLKAGVKLIPDEKVAFPTVNLPPGATPDNFTPPFFEEINGVMHVGPFPNEDIMELLEVVDGETLRYPLVLTNTTVAVNDILFASQGAGFMGRVLSVEVNGDFILAQLEEVGIFDVFDDIDVKFDSEELINSGLTTSAQLKDLLVANSTTGSLDTLAFDLSKCKIEGNISAAELNLLLTTKLEPILDIRLSRSQIKFIVGFKVSATLKAGFDLQARLKIIAKCPVKDPTDIDIPIPGPLGLLINGRIKTEYNTKIEIDTKAGPRVAGQAEVGFSLLLQVGYDSNLENSNASKVDFKPKADAKFSSDLLNVIDDWNFKVSIGTFVEPKAGIQFGGVLLRRLEAIAAWFGKSSQDKVKELKNGLFFDILKGKSGPVASATWESPARVINRKGSKTDISIDKIFEVKIESDKLNIVLGKLKITTIRVNLVKIAVGLGKLHRVFEPEEIKVKSSCFDDVIKKEDFSTKTVCARSGEVANFSIKVKYKGVPLLPFAEDAPLQRGEVWLGQDRKILDITNVDDTTKIMTINMKLTEEICGVGALSFLAFNTKWIIPTSGYAGDVKLNCGINKPPSTDAIGISTSKDTPINIDAVKFANDPNGDPLTVSVELLPETVGSAKVNANQTITYTPKAGFLGLDRFNYSVDDGFGGKSSAQVSVFVIDNNVPVIDSFTATPIKGLEALETTINLEVSNVDGDVLKCVLDYGDGQIEKIDPCTKHSFVHTYIKAGIYTLKLTVDDGKAGKAEKPININVLAANKPPIATDDEFAMQPNTFLLISARDLLDNDQDPEKGPLDIIGVPLASSGTVTLNDAGYTYEPNKDFFGVDFFSYTIKDNAGNQDTALVFISVSKIDNNSPIISEFIAVPNSGEVPLTVNFAWSLDDEDGDSLSCNMDFGDGSPVQVIKDCANNNFATHTYNKEGAYTVKLSATDNNGGRDKEILTVNIQKANQPPIAIDDTFSIFKNNPLSFKEKSLLVNDSDPDGDSFSLVDNFVETSQPKNGKLSIKEADPGELEEKEERTYIYEPNKDFVGVDSFIYKIKDTAGNEATAKVTLLVIDKNTPPNITNFSASPITGEIPITTTFEWLIDEPDGDNVTCTINFGDGSTSQTISDCVNNNSTSHNYSEAGSYVITLTASDSKGDKDEATVEVVYKLTQVNKDIVLEPIIKNDWSIDPNKEVAKNLPIIDIDITPTFPRADLRIGGIELQSTDGNGNPNNPSQDVEKITIGIDNNNDNKIDSELGSGNYSPNSNVTKIAFTEPLRVDQVNNLTINYDLRAAPALSLSFRKGLGLAAFLLLIPFGLGLYYRRKLLAGFLLISTVFLVVSCSNSTSKPPQSQSRTHQLHITAVDAWSEITKEKLQIEGLPISSAVMTVVD